MNQYYRLTIGCLFLLSACQESTQEAPVQRAKHNKLTLVNDSPKSPPQVFSIDTTAILTNLHLEEILKKIEQDSLIESRKVSSIPPIISSFLKHYGGPSFSIADYGQPFNATDNIIEERSNRQLLYLGVGKKTIIIAYYLGGFGLSERVLLFEMDNNSIKDFWTGYLRSDALTKNQIIQVLRTNRNRNWGTNTNILYF
ncbi:hypothetical protein HMJ29_18180 [Hymenobacter taeanensis]|uniref:Uncharacterized protein n=1 Tax=Hymenobacter taeanensis TaxID=2735321 RepID=A0A6M6BLA8_9BACT|nr:MULTISPECIES: hypothetical protein [Hymenobacter]QJX48740.1 hypothetical protein HMJ29_18180 [Hymenobacter taeanensis]UOQ81758.1 hypothetical protein MUN83_02905 [Hymenobacter sp. 5414T-23]